MRDAAARKTKPRAGKTARPRPRKVATNLSLRVDLVERARALDLNLSNVVEQALASAIRETEQARWLAENRQAIEQYNAFVEEHGLFGEEFRGF